MDKIIELKKVGKVYGGPVKTPVLFDIDLSIVRGSKTAIIGQSGSGKTTLMNIVGTLDRPTSGEVYIDGQKTNRLSKAKLARLRNRTIGFIFQFHYLLPEFTVLENVLMPERIRYRTNQEHVQRAKGLLALTGLADLEKKMVTKISGGQQQRVAIARALMNQPKIVLADEPTGNLDSANTMNVYQLFCRINKKLGTTFVIVTHDDRIARQADRIVEIKDGRIVGDKPNQATNQC